MQLAQYFSKFDKAHLRHLKGVGTPILILAALAMVVLPLPPLMLDVLFSFNIALALVVLLVTIYTKRPLDFGIFPSVLLVATILRLALNVASTRVVLLEGHNGGDAAGAVIALREVRLEVGVLLRVEVGVDIVEGVGGEGLQVVVGEASLALDEIRQGLVDPPGEIIDGGMGFDTVDYSASVGSAGARPLRFSLVTPRARTLPLATWGMPVGRESNSTCTWPVMRSGMDSAVPL